MEISDETFKFIVYVAIGSLIVFLILVFFAIKYVNPEIVRPFVR